MTRAPFTRFWPVVFSILVSTVLPTADLHAAARMLDRLEVRSGTQYQDLHIKFNQPMRYIAHAPLDRGDFLQVELRFISVGETEEQEEGAREALSWKPSAAVPLVEVAYESISPRLSRLTLRFIRPVQYSVKGGSDFRSLVVTLPAAVVVAPEEVPALPAAPPAARGAAEASPPPEAAPRMPVTILPEAAAASPVKPTEFDVADRYAINLESSQRAVPGVTPPDLEVLGKFRLYTTKFIKGNTIWNRLRLGFFPTEDAAKEARASLLEAYPEAWITWVSREERLLSAQQALTVSAATPADSQATTPGEARETGISGAERVSGTTAPPSTPPSAPSPTSLSTPPSASSSASSPARPPTASEKLAGLMKEAAAAMTAGNVRRAVQLYTKVLQSSGDEYRQEAQELLGLARERNKQLAHAKAEYEEYLRRYPEGEGAERVRQRLAGLLTARARPKEKLRKAKALAQEQDLVWGFTGSVSQQYNRDERFTDIEGRIVNRSDLTSNLDLNGSVGDDRYEAKFRFSGAHTLDSFEEGSTDDGSLSTVYVDVFDSQLELFGRFGRQSRSSGGVLGRHDGALVSYQLTPKVRINGVAGFPVTTTKSITFKGDRYFYGLSLDLGTFAENWDGNVFVIDQEVDGLTDRRALGGEVRFFSPNFSAFGLVDYDIFYNSLNIALLNGNYVFPDRTTVNFSLNYRNSPILTTTSAIQGQGVDSLSALLNNFSAGEVYRLAEDRISVSRSATIGASRPLNGMFQISADVTATDLSDSEASGNVEAIPGTGVELYYSAQLIGSSVIKEGDIAILGFRYVDTDSFERYTIDLNTRYPVSRSFRVSPRLRTAYRLDKDDDDTQLSVRPSLRLTYYWDRGLQFELDAGGEWVSDQIDGESDKTVGLFFNLGYRFDF